MTKILTCKNNIIIVELQQSLRQEMADELRFALTCHGSRQRPLSKRACAKCIHSPPTHVPNFLDDKPATDRDHDNTKEVRLSTPLDGTLEKSHDGVHARIMVNNTHDHMLNNAQHGHMAHDLMLSSSHGHVAHDLVVNSHDHTTHSHDHLSEREALGVYESHEGNQTLHSIHQSFLNLSHHLHNGVRGSTS